MMSKLLVMLVTGLLLLSADRGHTQDALPVPIDRAQPAGLQGGMVFAPNPARTVRLTVTAPCWRRSIFPPGCS